METSQPTVNLPSCPASAVEMCAELWKAVRTRTNMSWLPKACFRSLPIKKFEIGLHPNESGVMSKDYFQTASRLVCHSEPSAFYFHLWQLSRVSSKMSVVKRPFEFQLALSQPTAVAFRPSKHPAQFCTEENP